jgi:copper chaperone
MDELRYAALLSALCSALHSVSGIWPVVDESLAQGSPRAMRTFLPFATQPYLPGVAETLAGGDAELAAPSYNKGRLLICQCASVHDGSPPHRYRSIRGAADVSALFGSPHGTSESKEDKTMAQTLEFVVTGDDKMHCAGCEQRVSNALRRLPGVREVMASAATQQVLVTIDPAQVGAEQVRAKLEQLGYQVTP